MSLHRVDTVEPKFREGACRRLEFYKREDPGNTATDALCAAWEVLELRGPSGVGVALAEAVLGLGLGAAQRDDLQHDRLQWIDRGCSR